MDTLDLQMILRIGFSLLIVILLIFASAYIYRNFKHKLPGRSRRLKVCETFFLDPKTKLVLVKHDAQEHLVLITPTHSLLVNTVPQKETP